MLKVKNLSYCYPGAKSPVLEQVSLQVQRGEIVALVGQNGSGKSTLGKLMANLISPQPGEILVDQLDISERRQHDQVFRKIGIVFQNPENQIIFSNLHDELAFALRDLEPDEVARRIETALQQVAMQDYRDTNLYDLSLGQKQRVVIAEMLARQPNYLILDEPTTMIDSEGKTQIHQIVQQLAQRGIGVLLITNSAEEFLLADRIYILSDHRIVAEVAKPNLLSAVPTLRQYNIALPKLLQLADDLRKSGINLDLQKWNLAELTETLTRKLRGDE